VNGSIVIEFSAEDMEGSVGWDASAFEGDLGGDLGKVLGREGRVGVRDR
jgi:hypothetical protein